MRYELDSKVTYAGEVCTVWDYNQRTQEYTLDRGDKPRVYCVPETKIDRYDGELAKLKEQIEVYETALKAIRATATWGNSADASYEAYTTASKALKQFE